MKLGKLLPRLDSRTLLLSRYIRPDLPTPPSACEWAANAVLPMFCNDRLSCCVESAIGHQIETWSIAAQGHEATIVDDDVVSFYTRFGYDPADPTTDNGTVLLDALKSWRRTGMAGHTIAVFAAVNRLDVAHVEAAAWIFGGLVLGLALPLTSQDQDVWTVVFPDSPESAPGSLGGHCVTLLGYDRDGVTLCTWGERKRATWSFINRYCDEMFACVSDDFLLNNKAPTGLDIDQMIRDLAAL